MKSWKTRLLMALTMMAMLVMVAVPALASHDWDWYCVDWDEDTGECEEWLLCREVANDEWECIGPFDAPDDGDDDDDDDDNHDDGSGIG